MRKIIGALIALLWLLAATACAQERVVYLTFDDGPCASTPELLEALAACEAPATFFFVGARVKMFPEAARAVVAAGHAVGCHGMDHSTRRVREWGWSAQREMARFNARMAEVGAPVDTRLYRFPGGSGAYPGRCKRAMTRAGCAWFDWNAMTSDTEDHMSAQRIHERVMRTAGDAPVVILLAHEGKRETMRALPGIVEAFRARGYTFRVLSLEERDRVLLSGSEIRMGWPTAEGEGEALSANGA